MSCSIRTSESGIFCPFSKLLRLILRELVNIGTEIIFKNIEKNYLLVTYNPILALAIYIEYMKEIIARNSFS